MDGAGEWEERGTLERDQAATKKRTDDDREYGKREKGSDLHYESQTEPELAPRLRTNPLIYCGYDA